MWLEARELLSSAIVNADDIIKYDLFVTIILRCIAYLHSHVPKAHAQCVVCLTGENARFNAVIAPLKSINYISRPTFQEG